MLPVQKHSKSRKRKRRAHQALKPIHYVRCPQCGVWHHQSDELPCWVYSSSCSLCDHPTALDAGYRWIPGEL